MSQPTTGGSAAGAAPEAALETSFMIARRVVQDALWAGDRCNWVGAEPLERLSANSGEAGSAARLTYRALGPELYAGTSGVGLYLAELAAVTGDPEVRRTAIGALRHALSRREDVEPLVRRGMYVGWSGIGYAAIQVGTILQVPDMVERGLSVLRETVPLQRRADPISTGRSSRGEREPHEFDMIAGGAGAVLALLNSYRITAEQDLLTAGLVVAAELLRDARRHQVGWSWQSPGLRTLHDLTGLSHGAAGVAVALIEAHRVSSTPAHAEAARQAMTYENHWFDINAGNWPDFRPDVDGRRPSHDTLTFATLWCHGAPGIALARAHAYRHLGERQWLDDAAAALRTTQDDTESMMDTGGANYSLCHGLTGNAECLHDAGQAIGSQSPTFRLSDRVASQGIEHYAATGVPWPCGTHTESTPGLMLGTAGIGYFYLRRAVPQVNSILLPVAPPEDQHPCARDRAKPAATQPRTDALIGCQAALSHWR